MNKTLRTASFTLLASLVTTASLAGEAQQCTNPDLIHREYGVSFKVDCKSAGYTLRYTGELPKGIGPNTLRYDLVISKSGLIIKELSGRTYLEAPIHLGLAITNEASVNEDGSLKLKACVEPGCEVFKKVALEQTTPVPKASTKNSQAGELQPQESGSTPEFIIPPPAPLAQNSRQTDKGIKVVEQTKKGQQVGEKLEPKPLPEPALAAAVAPVAEGPVVPAPPPQPQAVKAEPKSRNIFESLKAIFTKTTSNNPANEVQVLDLQGNPVTKPQQLRQQDASSGVVVTPVSLTSFSVANPDGTPVKPPVADTPSGAPASIEPPPEVQPEPEVDERLKRARERAARLNRDQ